MSLQELQDLGLSSTSISKFIYQTEIDLVKSSVFSNNNILTHIEVLNAHEFEDNSFSDSNSLINLTLPGINEYSSDILASDINKKPRRLREITILNGTTNIGTMLKGLGSLQSVNLPQSLTSFTEGAFDGCKKINNLIISENSQFALNQFKDANSLKSLKIRLSLNNKNIGLSGLSNKSSVTVITDNSILDSQLFSNSNCCQIIFETNEGSIDTIQPGAFKHAKYLESIDLTQHSNLKDIPEEAFADCTLISSINFPESVQSIGLNCFKNDIYLNINLPSHLTSIQYTGKYLKDIIAPDTMHEIGVSAFAYASFSNTEINLPDIENIKSYAFIGSNIKSVHLGNDITSIYQFAFAECKQLTSFTFSGIKSLGQSAFFQTSLTSSQQSIIDMTSVDKYEEYSMAGIESDMYINMSPEITSNGNFTSNVFSGSYVKNININISNQEFNNLSSVAGGTLIPKSLQSKDIVEVYNRIKDMFGSATDFVLILNDVTFDKDGELAEYECLIYNDPDKKILKKCDPSKSDYDMFIKNPVIPSRVTTIMDSAFQNQLQLTSITVNNVFSIGNEAFSGCKHLEIIIGDEITEIGHDAFSECSSLKIIDMHHKLQTIGSQAFQNCVSMTDANISQAQYIGQYAFSGCTSLTSVNIDSVVALGYMSFANCDSLQTINIPKTINKEQSGINSLYSCDSLIQVNISGDSLNVPDKLVNEVPSSINIFIPDMSVDSVKDDLRTNRFSTKPGSAYFTKDKSGIYPSLITKTSDHVIPIINGLIVDQSSLRVVGTDSQYKMWYVYESDLADLSGIDDNAFSNSSVQIIQLPSTWKSNKWSCIGVNVFDTSTAQYVRVNKNYEADNDNILYIKMFGSSNGINNRYIKFSDGRLISDSRFIYDNDPFIWDDAGTTIVGVNDQNISSTHEATVLDYTHAISSCAFSHIKNLNVLRIADRSSTQVVLSIFNDAFYESYSIASVIFDGSSNIQMSDNMFRDAYIKSLILPGILSIDGYGLQDASELQDLTYAKETQQINASAMIDCKPILSSLNFQNGSQLTSIGDYAFAEIIDPFPNIEKIDFSECTQLKHIGEFAFYNSLRSTVNGSLDFPQTISSISKAAFAYKNGYSDYHKISSLNLEYSNIESIGPSAFMNNSFKKISFGSRLTSIGDYAFARPSYKFDIDIPASVLSIGDFAFKNNVILNPDNLKNNVISTHTTLDVLSTMIGLGSEGRNINEKFQATNTLGLSRNTVISALDSPYESGFIITTAPDENPRDCLYNFCPYYMNIDIMNRRLINVDSSITLTSIYMPVYLTSISPSALMDCRTVVQLCNYYDDETYYISCANDYQFFNCCRLSNVKLLSTATHIGECSFYNCKSLTAVYDTYEGDKWQYFKLSSIGPSAFMNCSSLKTFSICSSITQLCVNMFDNCSQLSSIDINMNVDDFCEKFRPNKQFTTIKSIIKYYFQGISEYAKCRINFRDSVYTNDGNIKLDPEFVSLRSYGTHGELSAISGLVFNGPHGEDIRKQTYLNLSSISMVDPFVFDGIVNLRSINILENEDESSNIYLSSIGQYAFYNCKSLNSVNGCKLSCIEVGQYAFGKCSMLLDMQFDLSKLKTIGAGAFYGTNLNALTFVDSKEVDINESMKKVTNAIRFNPSGNRNPLELPEGCMVYLKLSNDVTYTFNYLLDDLSSSIIDINRHALIFTDKTTSSIKPLVLLESTQLTAIPAVVANTYHANIIGRWK